VTRSISCVGTQPITMLLPLRLLTVLFASGMLDVRVGLEYIRLLLCDCVSQRAWHAAHKQVSSISMPGENINIEWNPNGNTLVVGNKVRDADEVCCAGHRDNHSSNTLFRRMSASVWWMYVGRK